MSAQKLINQPIFSANARSISLEMFPENEKENFQHKSVQAVQHKRLNKLNVILILYINTSQQYISHYFNEYKNVLFFYITVTGIVRKHAYICIKIIAQWNFFLKIIHNIRDKQ